MSFKRYGARQIGELDRQHVRPSEKHLYALAEKDPGSSRQ